VPDLLHILHSSPEAQLSRRGDWAPMFKRACTELMRATPGLAESIAGGPRGGGAQGAGGGTRWPFLLQGADPMQGAEQRVHALVDTLCAYSRSHPPPPSMTLADACEALAVACGREAGSGRRMAALLLDELDGGEGLLPRVQGAMEEAVFAARELGLLQAVPPGAAGAVRAVQTGAPAPSRRH
jgi:hypothetical protein